MCTTLSRYDLFNGPASWRASKSDYISQPLSVMAKTFYTIGLSEPKRQPNCPFESPLRQSSLFKCRFIWRKQKRQRSSLPKHLLCWKKVERSRDLLSIDFQNVPLWNKIVAFSLNFWFLPLKKLISRFPSDSCCHHSSNHLATLWTENLLTSTYIKIKY